MVRRFGIKALAGALLGSSLAMGQVPAVPAPAPTTRSGDQFLTIREPGKPEQKCKVLKKWTTKEGALAYEVQDAVSGEVLTILEGTQGPGAAASNARVYAWGQNQAPPAGAPTAPVNAVTYAKPMARTSPYAAGMPAKNATQPGTPTTTASGPALPAAPQRLAPVPTPSSTVPVNYQTPSPAASTPAVPTDPTGTEYKLVREPGKADQKCRVLQKWQTREGATAYQCESITSNELMTIVESESGRTGGPVQARIFTWRDRRTPPAGVQAPPGGFVVAFEAAQPSHGMPMTSPAAPVHASAPLPALPAMPASTPLPLPTAAPAAAIAAEVGEFKMIQEGDQPAQKCKVLKKWTTQEGMQAYQVQNPATGEQMTIVEGTAAPGARGGALAARIFPWGRNQTPPSGSPLPPDSTIVQEGPTMSRTVAAATPAQPSDWRKSWGMPEGHEAKPANQPTIVSRPRTPTPAELAPAAMLPTVASKSSEETKPLLLPMVTSNPIPEVKPSTPAPAPKAVADAATKPRRPWQFWQKPDEVVVGPASTAKTAQPTATAKTETTPKTETTAKASAPATPPKPQGKPGGLYVKDDKDASASPVTKDGQTKSAPVETAAAGQSKSGPARKEEPKSEVAKAEKPDPLAQPEAYSRRPLEATKPATPAPAKPAAPPAAKPATPPVQQAATKDVGTDPKAGKAIGAPAMPAGVKSVLAAHGGAGSPMYVPVPVVTLPSATAPLPNMANAPRPPQPLPPPQQPQADIGLNNAFTPPPDPMSQAVTQANNTARNAFSNESQPVRGMANGFTAQSQPNAMASAFSYGVPTQEANPMYQQQMQYQQQMLAQEQMMYQQQMLAQQQQMMMARSGSYPAYAGWYQGGQGVYPGTATMPAYPPQPAIAMAPPGTASVAAAQVNPGLQTASYSAPAQPAASGQLLAVLRDALYPSQREEAAIALASGAARTDPQVIEALIVSASQDAAATVRAACVRCLVKMQVSSPHFMGALERLKGDDDPRVRFEAEKALAGPRQ